MHGYTETQTIEHHEQVCLPEGAEELPAVAGPHPGYHIGTLIVR
jgi:hypothetical protein